MTDGLMVALGQLLGAQQPYDAQAENARVIAVEMLDGPAQTYRVADFSHYFDNISHRGGGHARMHLEGMAARIERVRHQMQKLFEDAAPDRVAAARAAFDVWAAKHIRLSLAHIRRHGSMASPMVTGPSNFPVRRQQKLQRWADNAEAIVRKHAETAVGRLKRIVWPHGAPGEAIRSNNPEAIDLLRAKAAKLEADQEAMKALNAAWRKAGKPGRDSDEAAWQRFGDLASLSPQRLHIYRRSMCDHYMADHQPQAPVETWQLSNNLATIKATRARLADLEAVTARGEQSADVETSAGVVRVVEDPEAARVQLFFPGKPDASTRTLLKSHGFRWAPSVGAWQRHLTNSGRFHADAVLAKIRTTTAA